MGQWPPGVMLMQEERAATYKNSALVVVKTAMSKRVEWKKRREELGVFQKDGGKMGIAE